MSVAWTALYGKSYFSHYIYVKTKKEGSWETYPKSCCCRWGRGLRFKSWPLHRAPAWSLWWPCLQLSTFLPSTTLLHPFPSLDYVIFLIVSHWLYFFRSFKFIAPFSLWEKCVDRFVHNLYSSWKSLSGVSRCATHKGCTPHRTFHIFEGTSLLRWMKGTKWSPWHSYERRTRHILVFYYYKFISCWGNPSRNASLDCMVHSFKYWASVFYVSGALRGAEKTQSPIKQIWAAKSS